MVQVYARGSWGIRQSCASARSSRGLCDYAYPKPLPLGQLAAIALTKRVSPSFFLQQMSMRGRMYTNEKGSKTREVYLWRL